MRRICFSIAVLLMGLLIMAACGEEATQSSNLQKGQQAIASTPSIPMCWDGWGREVTNGDRFANVPTGNNLNTITYLQGVVPFPGIDIMAGHFKPGVELTWKDNGTFKGGYRLIGIMLESSTSTSPFTVDNINFILLVCQSNTNKWRVAASFSDVAIALGIEPTVNLELFKKFMTFKIERPLGEQKSLKLTETFSINLPCSGLKSAKVRIDTISSAEVDFSAFEGVLTLGANLVYRCKENIRTEYGYIKGINYEAQTIEVILYKEPIKLN